jgi:hypothetical protein
MVTNVCYLVTLALVCFHSWYRQRNPIVLWHTDIGRVIEEMLGYAVEIMNGIYMRASVTR